MRADTIALPVDSVRAGLSRDFHDALKSASRLASKKGRRAAYAAMRDYLSGLHDLDVPQDRSIASGVDYWLIQTKLHENARSAQAVLTAYGFDDLQMW